jgi:tetratricopeptide (TPR) repeat protein
MSSNGGNILIARMAFEEGDYEKAVRHCHCLLMEDKTNADAFDLMGAVCMREEKFDRAEKLFARAIAVDPTRARSHANRAAALRECDRIQESIQAGERAVELAPNEGMFLLNLGTSLTYADQHMEARECFRGALLLQPNDPEAHVCLGHNLLLHGEWDAGWREAAWQVRLPGVCDLPKFRSIAWNGMRMPGEKLVVVIDQGFGDAIQYARYLPWAAARCGGVILVGFPQLSLLGRMHGVEQYVSDLDAVPPHGAHCRISSLPALGSLDDSGLSYLQADHNRVHEIASQLSHDDKFRIGLSWRGRAVPRGRSIPLPLLADALRNLDATFFCLQADATDEEKAILPDMLCPPLTSFEDTAAVMANLDTVVTIDSAVAHLAGATGTNAYVLLSRYNDWRWGLEESGMSPFYESVDMIRQTRQGDWASALEKLRAELS